MQGKVSSKYQLTLPTEVRKALGVKPGDIVTYEVIGGTLQVSRVRPSIEAVLDSVTKGFDFSELQEVTKNDAVAYLREQRLDGRL